MSGASFHQKMSSHHQPDSYGAPLDFPYGYQVNSGSHIHRPDEADPDALFVQMVEPPLKMQKTGEDTSAPAGMVRHPGMPPVNAVVSLPSLGPAATNMMSPKFVPAPADGFKFQLGSEVEYFIPDEDSYFSFGWLRARIISRGKKQIGSTLLPHYLVEPLDGDEKVTTTVEEWQLRPLNRSPTGMTGKRLQKHIRVEVHTKLEEGLRADSWFCAEVSEESSASDEFVRVRFRNQRWNVAGKGANSVHKARLRLVPMEDLHPPHGVSAKIWAIGGARLPIRLLGDEEHKVQELLNHFEAIRSKWIDVPIIKPVEFETDRDTLNEICDSLNNLRYYAKSAELIKFLLEIHRRFE